MPKLASGARLLPAHHITIRVPWHDSGWAGRVCARPQENTSCLILPRIGEGKRDDVEARYAGKQLDELSKESLPPCVAERASFMAPFELVSNKQHPYTETSPDTHSHFVPTRYVQPPYSAACTPYNWMLRENIEGEQGFAEQLQIDWVPEREPTLKFETAWAQARDNQIAILDTFYGALRPKESLCFFYAKRTPLSEQSRRVIVGVGRVLSVGQAVEYQYSRKNPPLRSVLWERNVGHSIRRTDFNDGFLFPYQEIMESVSRGEIANPEEFVAFAPDEYFDHYSYGSELLTHDGAVASLIACSATLDRIQGFIEGPWESVLSWIDTQLNRLWKVRGAFPGLGSALSAFGYEWGFQHGNLLAYEIELERERSGNANSWEILDEIMRDPKRLKESIRKFVKPRLREGWNRLDTKRRALLELLSRCAINEAQALRIYDKTERENAGIKASDDDFLANPYLFFERDRRSAPPITFGAVDRGLFPDEVVRQKFPAPELSCVDDPSDPRRVRARVVELLEEAATRGHTVLPQNLLIQNARAQALQPPCPLGENVLDATEPSFDQVVQRVDTGTGNPAYQIDWLVNCRKIIRREVSRRQKGRPHEISCDWRGLVDQGLHGMLTGQGDEELENQARSEKAAAIEQLCRSRLSVLIGPAGTGKTTLLKMVCGLPDVRRNGILLLAPTGKARVRLEEQTEQRGAGRTLAQFLSRYGRYNGETGAYSPNLAAPRCNDFRTVIVDECSMLTEDQLAALFDACTNVERYILVGDPRQLPPIGAGRPFVDIVKKLSPENIEASFPRCAPSYAELTVPRRQTAVERVDDVRLASHFNGRPLDPDADQVWDTIAAGGNDRLRVVQWGDTQDLQRKMSEELVAGLGLEGPDDERGFEISLGGSRFKDLDRAFFSNEYEDRSGAARKVENWQILSPIRAGLEGVEALNRAIQEQFRVQWREVAEMEGWGRKVPQPFGRQGLLYGDKVINIVNQRRRDVYPRVEEGEAYIANGDIGIVVGQYKHKKFKGLPWKLEVEFSGQLGTKYRFSKREFGDEAMNPLELAYALTVHKTQGSEFRMTFVVLPNPCWLLSREMLYTALTRHRDRLVILHQGPLADFRRYAGEEYSEIVRRMTNLFVNPRPREVIVAQETNETRFLEESLIHRTERGGLVRSKSELVIADKLYARGIDYSYEDRLVLPDGKTRYPDFTIADPASGVTFYWEHLGMLGNPGYRARWEHKRKDYITAGILPYEDGGGPEGTLIETYDNPDGGLDSQHIAGLIEELLV